MNPFSPSPSSSTGAAAAAAAGTHHPASDQDFAHLRSTSTGFELVRDPTLSHSSSSDTHSSSPAGTRSSGSASPAFGHTSSSAQTQSTATTPLTRSYTGSSADTVTPGDARQEHFEMARTDQEQEMQEPVSPWLSSSVGTIAAVGLPPGAGLTQPPGLVTQKSSSSVIRPGGNAVELTIERTTTIPNAQGPRSLSTVSNLGSLQDSSPSPVAPTATATTTNPQAAMTSSSLFPPGPAPPLPPRPSASKLSPLLHHGGPPPSLPGDKLRRRDDTLPTLGDDVDPHSPEQLLEDNCYLLWQLRRVHRTVKQAGRLAEELDGLCEEERRVDRKLADVSRVHALILCRVLGQDERRAYHYDRGGSAGEHGGYRQHGGHHQHRYHEAGRPTLSGGLALPVRGPIGSPSARVLY